jgi:hypothetical protein
MALFIMKIYLKVPGDLFNGTLTRKMWANVRQPEHQLYLNYTPQTLLKFSEFPSKGTLTQKSLSNMLKGACLRPQHEPLTCLKFF